jgi:hypothetical protein
VSKEGFSLGLTCSLLLAEIFEYHSKTFLVFDTRGFYSSLRGLDQSLKLAIVSIDSIEALNKLLRANGHKLIIVIIYKVRGDLLSKRRGFK